MNDSKCTHDVCNCQTDSSQRDGYCSESCRSGQTDNGKCGCGHPDCQ